MSDTPLKSPLWDLVPKLSFQLLDDTAAARRGDDKGHLRIFIEALESFLESWTADTTAVVRKAHNLQEADAPALRLLAWRQGLRSLPSSGFPRLRAFLANNAPFRAWKGNYDLLGRLVFLASGVPAEIEVPWHDEEGTWTVGVTRVGTSTSIGYPYRPESPWTLTVGGTAHIGKAHVGSVAINETFPFTVRIKLAYPPGGQALSVIEWVLDHFLRAIDIAEIVLPGSTDWWTIGKSKVGLGTTVAPGSWTVGVSIVGGGYIGSSSTLVERIRLPDGTLIEDI